MTLPPLCLCKPCIRCQPNQWIHLNILHQYESPIITSSVLELMKSFSIQRSWISQKPTWKCPFCLARTSHAQMRPLHCVPLSDLLQSIANRLTFCSSCKINQEKRNCLMGALEFSFRGDSADWCTPIQLFFVGILEWYDLHFPASFGQSATRTK
jgi:hypothetical protein